MTVKLQDIRVFSGLSPQLTVALACSCSDLKKDLKRYLDELFHEKLNTSTDSILRLTDEDKSSIETNLDN